MAEETKIEKVIPVPGGNVGCLNKGDIDPTVLDAITAAVCEIVEAAGKSTDTSAGPGQGVTTLRVGGVRIRC